MIRSRTVPPHDPRPDTEVWLNDDGSVLAYGYADSGRHYIEFPGAVTFGIAVGAVTADVAPTANDVFVEEAYRRIVLPHAIHLSGGEALHGSAVVAESGVVVLCGEAEQGKSTLAFSLTRRGYVAWGDDAVALHTADGHAYSVAVPFRLRLRPEPRRVLGATGDPPENLSASSEPRPLAALFVLDRDTNASTPEALRLSGADAYVALLPHAYFFSADDHARMDELLERYLELASVVPTFALRFPTGLEHLEATVDAIEGAIASVGG